VVLSVSNRNKQKSFFNRLRTIFALSGVQGAFESSFDGLRMLPIGFAKHPAQSRGVCVGIAQRSGQDGSSEAVSISGALREHYFGRAQLENAQNLQYPSVAEPI
jgi:hypothetical protein